MGSPKSIGELINDSMIINDVKQSLTINESMNRDSSLWKSRKTKSLWKTHRITAQEAETKARFLVERLNAPECRNFFLKCVYHLSEADIQNALEMATRPYIKCKARYFNKCCKNKLTERGL